MTDEIESDQLQDQSSDHSSDQSKELFWQRRRLVSRGGSSHIQRLGLKPRLLSDSFHAFMRRPWSFAIAALAIAYVLANLAFAWAYYLAGDVIENARPGSFIDCFFFSVQTMATVGYGQLRPSGTLANLLAAAESFIGLLGFAVAAGLIFAKFARPTAKIVFSEKAVVYSRDGIPSLLFRIVNERSNQILEASLSATAMMIQTTKEGEVIRLMTDLKLIRSRTPIFSLTFTAVHPIDEKSPLFGLSLAELRKKQLEIIVTFVGVDDAFSANVHARHSYLLEEIEWGRRFEDIIYRNAQGETIVDYRKFQMTRDSEPALIPDAFS